MDTSIKRGIRHKKHKRRKTDAITPFCVFCPFTITGSIGGTAQVALRQLIRPIKILGDQNSNDNAWGKNQYDAMLAKWSGGSAWDSA
jgi:hypothetical protein